MGFADDFWGVLSALPVGPTAPAWALKNLGGGGEVQPPLTPEASQAAAQASGFADAPVSASATEDKPVYLGFEDIPGFDPQTDAPFLVVGKKSQKGRLAYVKGMERSEWSDMSEEQINKTKAQLYRAGYYGSKVPIMNGMPSVADADAMGKAMGDANMAGGIDWNLYLQRTLGATDNGAGAESRQAVRETRAAKASALTSLRGFAYENGIRLPNEFIKRKAEQIASGKVSEEELRNHMVNKFVARAYPTLAEDVKAGMTVRDAAAPYIASYAALLEVPESQVDLQDPLLKSALQHTNDKGEPADMPIWKFEEALKKDKRWQYTDNAWEEVGSQAYEVMKMFGYQA